MSAGDERNAWVGAVEEVAADRGLTYEEVGGLNPRDAPPALCPGGSNRLTGELAPGFWGSSCDAAEYEAGGMFGKTVLPAAILAKAHMPDLTTVVPAFDVESIEATPDEQLRRMSRLRVEFESIDFNRRFIATVPKGHDPIALRELFSPAFLTWTTSIDREVASEPPSGSSTSCGISASAPGPSSSWRWTTPATSSVASAPSSRRPAQRPIRPAPGTPGWSRSRASSRSRLGGRHHMSDPVP